MRLERLVIVLAAGLMLAACATDRFVPEDLIIYGTWSPADSEEFFIALSDGAKRKNHFLLRKRKIPDGELVWTSDDLPGDRLPGSLFNSPFDRTGFWVTGADYMAFFHPDSSGLTEIKRTRFAVTESSRVPDYPSHQACQVNQAGAFVAEGFHGYLSFLDKTSSRWTRVGGKEYSARPLCIEDHTFLVTEHPPNSLFAGIEAGGTINLVRLLEEPHSIKGYAYARSLHTIAVFTMHSGGYDEAGFYELDLSGPEPRATLKFRLRPGEQDIQAVVFHPTLPLVVTVHRQDKKVKLWDLNSNLLGTYQAGIMPGIMDVLFTHRGSYLILIAERGYVIKKTEDVFPVVRDYQ